MKNWRSPGQDIKSHPKQSKPKKITENKIEITHCIWCCAIVINGESDECPSCHGELESISHMIKPGTYIQAQNKTELIVVQPKE